MILNDFRLWQTICVIQRRPRPIIIPNWPLPATVFLLKFIQIRSAPVRDIYLFNIGNPV
jgi:hypothetical protein